MLSDFESGDLDATRRCLRDVIALSTLPSVWLGAEPLRVAESLAAALFTTLDADFVLVRLEDASGRPATVVQTGRHRTDPDLAERMGPAIADWARAHDPDELLELADAGGAGLLRIAARPLGFNASLGVVAAGFAGRIPTAFQHTALGIGANQAASAVQSAQLLRSLRASEQRYREIFHGAGVSIWEQDLSAVKPAIDALRAAGVADFRAYFAEHPQFVERAIGMVRIGDVNDAGLRLFGARGKQDLLTSPQWIFGRGAREAFVEVLVAMAEGRGALETDAVLHTLQGERRDVVFNVAFPAPDAAFDRVLVTLMDITERAAVERVAKALTGETSLEGAVQAVTDFATELSGAKFGAFFYNVKDAAGESYLLYTLSGAPREAFAGFGLPRKTALFGRTFSGSGIVRLDDVTKDPRYGKSAPHFGMPKGHLPVRSYLAVPVFAGSGEVIGGLFFGHPDAGVFTERAERLVAAIASQAAATIDNAGLHTQRAKLIEQLRESDRRKDEFLAMLSHELRNPLAPISHAVTLIRETEGDIRRQACAILERQVGHMIRLVDDLLDISRISRGTISIAKQPVEITAVVGSAIETARPLLDAAHHRLAIELPREPLVVDGDPVRLAQIVANLLNNAAKFTPQGGRIGVAVRREGDRVAVTVQDSGMGIEPDALPGLFDMFAQAESTRRRVPGGLGVGLALARQIAELHGGSVVGRSEGLGHGAEFTVCLPLLAAAPAVQRVAEPAGGPNGARRVLVVEDHEDAAKSLALLLEQLGHSVRIAGDGRRALDAALAEPPDIVLLDIDLPELDGYSVASRLRADGRFASVPIVALTGLGQEVDRRRTLESGFDAHLVKPVDQALLLEVLAMTRSGVGGVVAAAPLRAASP